MDSVGFCGEACHTVMAPELAAYKGSPHSRIGCVECRIGAGAGWFVKSKLSGTRQVIAVALKTYSTPIPSPVHHLRPARETCEQCHSWRSASRGTASSGSTRRTRRTAAADSLGAGDARRRVERWGERRHPRPAPRFRIADQLHGPRREAPADRDHELSRRRRADGRLREHRGRSRRPRLSRWERRGRWTASTATTGRHTRSSCPIGAFDRGITAQGAISRDLPFVKKKALELLKVKYASQEEAMVALLERLNDDVSLRVQLRLTPASSKKDIDASVKTVQAVPEERPPEHRRRLGLPPEHHRPRGLPGLLPLPRRHARRRGR